MQTRDTFFFGNFSPFVYAQAISFFVFALTWRSNPLLKFKFLPYWANLGLGAYLIHIFYLTNLKIVFQKFKILVDSPVVLILILTLSTYLLSNVTTAVIKKIPYLRRVV
jgi:peptidoglycan/LPS O-acetylase OafA/YrhL